MTKEELMKTLSKKTGIEFEMVRVIVDAFATEVSTQLLNGEDVHMRGFGSFMIKHCAQRKGRLIKKKKSIIIPAHDRAVFKVSENLSKRIKAKSINKLPS